MVVGDAADGKKKKKKKKKRRKHPDFGKETSVRWHDFEFLVLYLIFLPIPDG